MVSGKDREGGAATVSDADACMAPVAVRRPAQLTVLFSPGKTELFGHMEGAPSDDQIHARPRQFTPSSSSSAGSTCRCSAETNPSRSLLHALNSREQFRGNTRRCFIQQYALAC
jgi:hypothetical protein